MGEELWENNSGEIAAADSTDKIIQEAAKTVEIKDWSTISDMEKTVKDAVTKLEKVWLVVWWDKEKTEWWNNNVDEKKYGFVQALDMIAKNTTTVEWEKWKESLGDKIRECIKNKEYGKALVAILEMLFLGDWSLNFTTFHGESFPKLTQEELENMYKKEPDETKNSEIDEMKCKIETTDNVNQKLSYGFVLTQIQDYFLTKKLQTENPNKQPDDMDLLVPRLQKWSIICMRQERQNPDVTMKLWDAGMIANDNKTIVDFTHTAIITETKPEPMITHATMKEWVHTQSLREYLAQFPQTNIAVMNPNDEKLGSALSDSCLQKIWMQYDKWAPTAEFLWDVDIKNKFNIKDDKAKTNCVEFIADALFAIDPKYTEIEDKAHPNDMLAIAKKWYSVSYVKTYSSVKKESSS